MNNDKVRETEIEVAKALITAQYTSLRTEIEQRIILQHQLILFTLGASGAVLAFGSQAQNEIPTIVFLLYPIVGALVTGSWAQHNESISSLAKFIRENIEDAFLGKLILEMKPDLIGDEPAKEQEYKKLLSKIGWENYISATRNISIQELGQPSTGWLRIWHPGIVFLITGLAASITALLRMSGKPEEFALLAIDFLALIVTAVIIGRSGRA